MGLPHLREIMNRLVNGGCDRCRPVALIQSGTFPHQRSLFGTVETIADLADKHGFQAPTTIIIGKIVNLGQKLLYANTADFSDTREVRSCAN